MTRFLREHWPWVVVPMVIVAAVVVALLVFGSGAEGPGHYEL